MEQVILLVAVVILACVVAGRLSSRLGVPALLLFMALGMVFGSDGLFKIAFDSYRTAEQICSVALIFIMFYGGFGTRWDAAKPVALKAVCLSTLGVAATALLTAAFCYLALGFPALESFLTGAVISSTDAASVFSILRSKRLGLKENTASLLELESGSNDPASYMLTVVALSMMGEGQGSGVGKMIFAQVVFGAAIGVAVALFARFVLRELKLADGSDAIFGTAIALLSFALPAVVGGNGYLGAYLAGILLGNSSIPRKASLVHFFDGVTGLAQILIFFLLGLLAFPRQIPSILLPAVGIALFLTFVARPAAVFAILMPFRCSWRQMLVTAWAGLRGAASIVFAIMAVAGETEIGNDLFHIVFCVSLLSVAFQGSLLPWVSRKLLMVDSGENVSRTFTDYQDEHQMHLTQFQITEGHPWAGKKIGDCHLPVDALVVVVRRGSENLIPNGSTEIREGDLVVLSTPTYEDDAGVSLMELPVLTAWDGKAIKELGIPSETLIVLVKRPDGTTVVPKGGTVVRRGDVLVVNET